MNPPPVGLPAAEPKNGDFVAYLAEIERLQLQRAAQSGATVAAPAANPARAAPPRDAAQAAALRARLAAGGDGKTYIGPALLGAVGLLFIVLGLADDAGFIAVLVGGFLLWRAWVALRKSSRSVAPDAAARITALLRQAQAQARNPRKPS